MLPDHLLNVVKLPKLFIPVPELQLVLLQLAIQVVLQYVQVCTLLQINLQTQHCQEHLVQVLAHQAIAILAIQAANVIQVLHLIHIVRHVLPEIVIQV